MDGTGEEPVGDLPHLAIRGIFASNGPLARPSGGHAAQGAQSSMAVAVAEAVASGGLLAVEAGTGVGKTWAYLAPILMADQRAWLSTATQALQDQLFQRDIPALSRALGLPVRVALLKGRSNYVCLQRLEMLRSGALNSGINDPAWSSVAERIHRWAIQSVDGDLAELPGLDDDSPLRPWISSSRENCLGDACPRLSACHVFRARRLAMQADWVVINHHLFLASQLGRDDDLPALLPATQVVVFDEAHRLVELAETQLGRVFGSAQLLELARELSSLGPLMAKGLQPWAHRALMLELAVRGVSRLLGGHPVGQSQTPWLDGRPEGVGLGEWQQARQAVLSALIAAQDSLQAVEGAGAPLAAWAARARQWRTEWVHLLQDDPPASEPSSHSVRWIEHWPDGAWRVVRSAVDVGGAFQAAMRSAGPVQSWVFTSATMGTDDQLSWFTDNLGLRGNPALRTLRLASPFEHAAQASLYIPGDLPAPADERHGPALAASVARWAHTLGGRTLVLTTSLRACARIAGALREQLAPGGNSNLQVLAQGQGSKRALLARFRAAGQGGAGAVMVASATFWEGVDLPGDNLQLLVIDKLPFPSPGDPLTQARSRRAQAKGQDAFQAVYLQKAALTLKQGAGRLIRSASDRGVLVVADRRLLTQSYGMALIDALPPMDRLLNEHEMQAALKRLAARH